MSTKNQSRLPIFASLIIGVTVACLFGLNLLVDKLSKITPATVARQEPPVPSRPPMGPAGNDAHHPDDEYRPPNPHAPNPNPNTPMPANHPSQKINKARLEPHSPPGVIRRVHNGKNDPDIEVKGPPPQNGQPSGGKRPDQTNAPSDPRGGPQYPPDMKLTPEERDAMERELERRRQMMPDDRMPPSYYPPPPDFYPSPYDDYYDPEDYDYYDDYRGKRDDTNKENVKVSDMLRRDDAPFESPDHEFDPDDYLGDEYLTEDLD